MIALKTTIKMRRDQLLNYSMHGMHIPENGEVCLVDTLSGLRAKVGDGVSTFNSLPFADSMILQGYYDAVTRKFYKESTFQTELIADEKCLYVDKATKNLYFYNGSVYLASTVDIPTATDSAPGIIKIYQSYGQNTDGTMSQKVITDAISAIALDVEADGIENSLVLNKPW